MPKIYPSFDFTATVASPAWGMLRVVDGKRFDFFTNTFVSTPPNTPSSPLTPASTGDTLCGVAAGNVIGGVPGYDTTALVPSVLTDGGYIYEPYSGSTRTQLGVATGVWITGGTDQLAPGTAVIDSTTLAAIAANVAAAILASPANKLATDGSGRVTAIGGGGGGTTLTLASGTVSASPAATAAGFAATGTGLTAPSGGYVGSWLFFTSGLQATTKRIVTSHTVAGSVHTFGFAIPFGGAPVAADAFDIA